MHSRLLHLSGGLGLCLSCLAFAGCSRGAPTASRAPAPPEITAEYVFIHYPDIISGAPAGPAAAAGLLAPIAGVPATPGLRYSFTGSFANVPVEFFVDGVSLGTRTWSGDAASRSWFSVLGPDWVPPDSGTYTLRAVVDSTNAFVETDDGDNAAVITVNVRLGDLIAAGTGWIRLINGAWTPVDQVRAGEAVALAVFRAASGRFENVRSRIDVNGVVISDRRDTLSGGTLPHVVPDTVAFVPSAPGTYAATFDIDPDDEFREHLETNNRFMRTLTVGP